MAFLLAHLSDPHVPPLPVARLRELAGKRMLGYLNWTRNRRARHCRDMLDALVADMQAQRPDHIAMTGDLVNLSLASEYAPARRWIESVGTPDRVTVIPGNHDAYVRGALERFTREFAEYMSGDGTHEFLRFPFLRQRGEIALVATSSAVPTAPLMATGWLGANQRDALDTLLASLDPALFRIVLIHHPLLSHDRHKRLTDATEVTDILKLRGADLVLHGHDHLHSTLWIEGPRGKIPVVSVPSASAAIGGKRPPAAYNLFAITRAGGSWQCVHITRGFDDTSVLRELSSVRLL